MGIAREREANGNLWFLLARATGSLAVRVVQEFGGLTGSPYGKGAWRKLQEVYGGMTAEERPQQLLKAELRLAETICSTSLGPAQTASFFFVENSYLFKLITIKYIHSSLLQPSQLITDKVDY